jgi:plasmid replication initiation protein
MSAPPSPLLPERHKQKDFFIADIFDALPIKNDRHTMEHPFFALSTKPDIRTVHYERNGVAIKMNPHSELGLPTMFDKDILLYCGSLIISELQKNPSEQPPKKLRFSCHDLLITTNRHTNDVAYQQLKNAFERLKGVSITTDIKTNDIRETAGFGILDNWRIIEKSNDNRRMVRIEVTLSDWFYNALIAKEVLTINRDYFRLRKGLERRLYEIARKHCGYQSEWKVNLSTLHEKSGSRSPLKYFRFQIREIITNDLKEKHFPDYLIILDSNDLVTFKRKNHVSKKGLKNSIIPPLPSYIEDKYIFQKLTHKTLLTAVNLLDKNQIDISLESLILQFITHILKTKEPDNYNGAFIGFIKYKIMSI